MSPWDCCIAAASSLGHTAGSLGSGHYTATAADIINRRALAAAGPDSIAADRKDSVAGFGAGTNPVRHIPSCSLRSIGLSRREKVKLDEYLCTRVPALRALLTLLILVVVIRIHHSSTWSLFLCLTIKDLRNYNSN